MQKTSSSRTSRSTRRESATRAPGSGSGRGRSRSSRPDVAVFGITGARRSQQADVSLRARRYMISMTVRLLCFVLAFVLYGHWYAWVAAVGAVFLPYVAVLMANAGRERRSEPPTAMMAAGTGGGTGDGAGHGGSGAPAPRAIAAVPSRTVPASDPWADPRSAPPLRGAGWQHSYAAPSSPRPHGSAPRSALGGTHGHGGREKRRAGAS